MLLSEPFSPLRTIIVVVSAPGQVYGFIGFIQVFGVNKGDLCFTI